MPPPLSFLYRLAKSPTDRDLASGQKLLASHDPATGRRTVACITGINVPSTSSIAANADAVFFGFGAPFTAGPLYALGAGLAGDLSPHDGKPIKGQLWSKPSAAPGMPTPLVVGDYLYVLNNNVLNCHDIHTAELQYKERLPEMATVAASPVACGQHVVIVDEKGKALFVKAGPSFSVDASLEFDDVSGPRQRLPRSTSDSWGRSPLLRVAVGMPPLRLAATVKTKLCRRRMKVRSDVHRVGRRL